MEKCTKIKYPDYWTIKRNTPRPIELRVLGFNELYDWDTLWYDAVQINPTTILLIGPPLYDTKDYINRHCNFVYYPDAQRTKFEKLTHVFHEMDRVCITVINVNSFLQSIELVTDFSRIITIPVNPSQADFMGKKTIVTISKDHPVEWLQQWIDYHFVVHGIDGLLLYNNNSTIYSSTELEQRIARPDITIRVVDWPYPFGVMGGGEWQDGDQAGNYLPWDSDFAQYVMLEHAKYRYLHSAELVINADTDELLYTTKMSLAEICNYSKTSSNSVWTYTGTWIEPVDSRNRTIAKSIDYQHRRFSNYWHTSNYEHRGIGQKWMLIPQRNMNYQWLLHRTTGPHMQTSEIGFGHYLAMNTSWSWERDSYNRSIQELEEFSPVKQHLDRWIK
jgi:hypothetical protein